MSGEEFMRGLVKFVFIGCYIAFMWASIHHVAAFFNAFESDESSMVGSYALAGAFDITALVTTIGVMFFRRSMPGWVLTIVWAFILAIAAYSFFINWEYASHYQDMQMLMQPTGKTIPLYDAQGNLHYVADMQVNTSLIWVNPILASGFTIFSLIYSVIAEFFGTKPPTADELAQKKKYLEDTATIVADIKKLQAKTKGPGFIERAKTTATELAKAGKEVGKAFAKEDDAAEDSQPLNSGINPSHKSRTTDPLQAILTDLEDLIGAPLNAPKTEVKADDSGLQSGVMEESKNEISDLVKLYPRLSSLLSTGQSTASQKEIIEATGHSSKMVANRVADGTLKGSPRNQEKLLISSVLTWLKTAPLPRVKAGIKQSENIDQNDPLPAS